MTRRPLLLAALALLLAFLLGPLPVHATDRTVLVRVTVGDFTWQEGQEPRQPGAFTGRTGTLELKGSAPPVGQKWDELRIGLPKLPSGKTPVLVLHAAEVSAVATAGERQSKVSFVFQDITWTYMTDGKVNFDCARDAD